jgi:hypothetical protein
MQKVNQTLWESDAGRDLLRKNNPASASPFTVIVAFCSAAELSELADAIKEALDELCEET